MERPIAAEVVEPVIQRKKIVIKKKEGIPEQKRPTTVNIKGYLTNLNGNAFNPYGSENRFILLNKKVVDTDEVKRKQREISAAQKEVDELSDKFEAATTILQEARILEEIDVAEKKIDKLRKDLLSLLRGKDIPNKVLEEEERRPSKI
jgi:hypothetical protein